MGARVPTGISEANHPVSLQSQLERTQVGYLNGKCSAAKDEKNRVMIMRCTALQKRGSKLLKLITKPAERVA
jgi:hypothetical protein